MNIYMIIAIVGVAVMVVGVALVVVMRKKGTWKK